MTQTLEERLDALEKKLQAWTRYARNVVSLYWLYSPVKNECPCCHFMQKRELNDRQEIQLTHTGHSESCPCYVPQEDNYAGA